MLYTDLCIWKEIYLALSQFIIDMDIWTQLWMEDN